MKAEAIRILCVAACLVVPAAHAQDYPKPDQTLKIIVPFVAGGGVDNAARLLSERLRQQMGLNVIVENRAGANGSVGGRAVQLAAADGYTLLFSASTHIFAKDVMVNAPYDPEKDFVAVAKFAEAPLLLVVASQLGVTTLKSAIAATTDGKGPWSAALPAYGAASHLGTLLLAKQTGMNLQYVPYKGTQPALIDVAGGHVQLQFDSMVSLAPMARSGRVVPLAISSDKRVAALPQVPTFGEAGVPGLVYSSWYGVWAPKNTPPERVKTLNANINKAAEFLAQSGALDTLGLNASPISTEKFQSLVSSEIALGRDLLRASGFKPE